MKSLAIRLSVATLALAGFTASTLVSYASTSKHQVKSVTIGTMTPAPMCKPSDPSHCGMD